MNDIESIIDNKHLFYHKAYRAWTVTGHFSGGLFTRAGYQYQYQYL